MWRSCSVLRRRSTRRRRLLAAGEAVVLQPGAVGGDAVALRSDRRRPTGQEVQTAAVQVPAIEVADRGTARAGAGVRPALARPDLAGAVVAAPYSVLLVEPVRPTPRTDLRRDRCSSSSSTAGVDHEVVTSTDPVVVILRVGGGVTALLALLAGLMVTALALADGRADLATLAAVGAPPGMRRRLGAASAGFVAVLGCVVGAVSGWWVVCARSRSEPRLAEATGRDALGDARIVVVGVPLLTSAAAWLTTRSTSRWPGGPRTDRRHRSLAGPVLRAARIWGTPGPPGTLIGRVRASRRPPWVSGSGAH